MFCAKHKAAGTADQTAGFNLGKWQGSRGVRELNDAIRAISA